ncbi:MAG: hypothetical protein ACYDDF_05850 [Thermoplasmatota archaeon]
MAGGPRARPWGSWGPLGAMFVVGLFAGCIFAPASPTHGSAGGALSGPPADCGPGAPPPAGTPTGARAAGVALVIADKATFVDSAGFYRLVGEIRNDGSAVAWRPTATAVFADAHGNPLGSRVGYGFRMLLPPGGLTPFDLAFPDANRTVANATVQVSGNATALTPTPERDLFACNVTNTTDVRGFDRVDGTVFNNASHAWTEAIVIATFHATNGSYVGAQVAGTYPGTIASKAEASFSLTFDPRGETLAPVSLVLDAHVNATGVGS